MKGFAVNVLSLLAATASAAPSSDGCGDNYDYTPGRCSHCPYQGNFLERTGSCERECPKEKRQCLTSRNNNSLEGLSNNRYVVDQTENVDFRENFKIDVQVKFEECASEYSGQQCLNVNFRDAVAAATEGRVHRRDDRLNGLNNGFNNGYNNEARPFDVNSYYNNQNTRPFNNFGTNGRGNINQNENINTNGRVNQNENLNPNVNINQNENINNNQNTDQNENLNNNLNTNREGNRNFNNGFNGLDNNNRFNTDRFNNNDRFNTDRLNNDQFNNDQFNNDRFNNDRFNTDNRFNNNDRFNTDRLDSNRFDSNRFNNQNVDANRISRVMLGIYESQQETFNPEQLNFNNYCSGTSCSVPERFIPNSENLCDKEIFIAVTCEQSEQSEGNAVRYIPVRVGCDGNRSLDSGLENNSLDKEGECGEYCCCP